jgi:hypothetical protein
VHNYKTEGLNLNEGSFYIALNADVNVPFDVEKVAKLPFLRSKRENERRSKKMSLELDRRRKNFSLSKVKNKFNRENNFSNRGLIDSKSKVFGGYGLGINKSSEIEV